MPTDGPPISSQARAIPMRKQTITRIARLFTVPESPGWYTTSMPLISWRTNVTPSPARKAASRAVGHRTCLTRMSESSDATTNSSPSTATIVAAIATFSPGTSANSETVSALMNAVSAAFARIRCNWPVTSVVASRAAETEIATKSSPMSAPATPALARKKS